MKTPIWVEVREEEDGVVFEAKPYVFVKKAKGTKYSAAIEDTLRWGIAEVTKEEGGKG